MIEKKIDLSDVKVGDPLWTVFNGNVPCEAVNTKLGDAYPIIVGERAFGINGKYYDSDSFPTCFHSREEFLDFHGIALVRMTEKEFGFAFNDWSAGLIISESDCFRKGFELAGGQIIEEPTNLPCMNCGISVIDAKDAQGIIYHPKVNNCFLSNKTFNKDEWNDPSKRGNSNV
jgi:hypothetical protein